MVVLAFGNTTPVQVEHRALPSRIASATGYAKDGAKTKTAGPFWVPAAMVSGME